jgi:hypothetical protein
MKKQSLKQKLSIGKLTLSNFSNAGDVKGGIAPVAATRPVQSVPYFVTCICDSGPGKSAFCCDGV